MNEHYLNWRHIIERSFKYLVEDAAENSDVEVLMSGGRHS